MPHAPKPSERELQALLGRAAADFGFVKRKGVFVGSVAPGVSGWLAFQVRRESAAMDVAPNMGVRYEQLHALVDRLKGKPPGMEPTLARLLGYLMPEGTANVVWQFTYDDDATWEAQASNIMQNVERYGRPWMLQFTDLESILEGMNEHGLAIYNPERRPVALVLLGRVDEARRQLDLELSALGSRSDEAAVNYRRFAQALETELAAT